MVGIWTCGFERRCQRPACWDATTAAIVDEDFWGGSTLVRWSKCFPGTVTDGTIGRRDAMETRVEPSEGRVYVSINTDVEKRYVRAE